MLEKVQLGIYALVIFVLFRVKKYRDIGQFYISIEIWNVWMYQLLKIIRKSS